MRREKEHNAYNFVSENSYRCFRMIHFGHKISFFVALCILSSAVRYTVQINKQMEDNSLHRLLSFNCKNIKLSLECIQELCKSADIIVLQETRLLPNETAVLSSVNDKFGLTGTSAIDTTTTGMLRSRPYGGDARL